jgi:hypothetical protein
MRRSELIRVLVRQLGLLRIEVVSSGVTTASHIGSQGAQVLEG